MLTTLEGIYKDGKVELVEAPTGIDEGRVLVTFLPNRNLTEEDFKIAEFHGDSDDGLDWS